MSKDLNYPMNQLFKFLKFIAGKKDKSISIKSLIRSEAFLDYYLPDIVASLMYGSLFTCILMIAYSLFVGAEIKVSGIIIALSGSLACYWFSKTSNNEGFQFLVPTFLLFSYQSIESNISKLLEPLLYFIPVCFFLYFLGKHKSFSLRIEETCEKYTSIDKRSDDDFYYLLNHLRLYSKETNDLINLAHYNNKFNWLRDILSRTKISDEKAMLFSKVLPFLNVSPDEGYKAIKDFNLIPTYSFMDIRKYILCIDSSLSQNDTKTAKMIAIELLNNNKNINQIRHKIEQCRNEGMNIDSVNSLIERCWLEMTLKNNNGSTIKKVKI